MKITSNKSIKVAIVTIIVSSLILCTTTISSAKDIGGESANTNTVVYFTPSSDVDINQLPENTILAVID